ncbi:MAG: GIY-YIG nuclease family protein [Alphaproteobacteria bacterium]|nr:GIY-YIG nuclease family protein [Alphaproteobacteria bacterium]
MRKSIYEKNGYVYILFNKRNGALYTGVTSDLENRIIEHKHKKYGNSHTKKYDIDRLGYYEQYAMVSDAIEREKQIKGGSRDDKIKLIESMNPGWEDLYEKYALPVIT